MYRPPAPAAIPMPASRELPTHVGIIMDGNGRWAKQRHLPRTAGHRAGVRAIRPTIEAFHNAGVHMITLYAFSTENWSRSPREVTALMRLFSQTIDTEIDEMDAEGIQIRCLGDRSRLSVKLQEKLAGAEARTQNNQRAILNVALNYGGRAEILEAIRDLAESNCELGKITENTFSDALYTAGLPDPDLIIRTAGEMRLSNFLVWQSAYSEIYVTQTLWPDFGAAEVTAALQSYAARERRFGGVPQAND